MYCKKCGTEQKPGQKFCPKCGTPFILVEGGDDNVKSSGTDDEPQVLSNHDQAPSKASVSHGLSPKVLIALAFLIAIIGIVVWMQKSDSMSLNKIVDVFTSYEKESDIDGIPFKSSEKGKWGMMKLDGTIIFEEEFKDMPTLAVDGRFMVKNGNGFWEIYTLETNPVKVGDEYVSMGDFYHGVAPAVKKNEQISLIDLDGNVITVLEKSGSKPITRMENFHYGYALFEAEDAVGIVNTRGEILLEAQNYCKIYHVAPKRFLALSMKYKDETDKHNLVYDVIDPVGNLKGKIRMSKYDDIAVLADGYIGIEQTSDGEKLYGIMDLEGNVIVKPTSKIRGLTAFNDDKFVFSNGDQIGVRTIKDQVLIRAKYDAIVWATDELLWVNSSVDGRQGWALIDLEGNKITKDVYQDALPFYDGKNAFVQITDKTWGIINIKGEEKKNTPDIYTVLRHKSYDYMTGHGADGVIYSDYVDMEAILSAVMMTSSGFGGFGINMTPIELIKIYNEYCEEGNQLKLNPEEVNVDKLSYNKEIMRGIDLNVQLYYSGYMTERGDSHFDDVAGEWIQAPVRWTKEKPQYIKMSVSGSKLRGKTDILYRKLLVKTKAYGQVFKENDHACIVVRDNGIGFILVNTGSEVWAMVKGIEALRNENIEQYSYEETRTGAGYAEKNRYVDTDTIEEIYDSLDVDINY
jgi:hypothetical protein